MKNILFGALLMLIGTFGYANNISLTEIDVEFEKYENLTEEVCFNLLAECSTQSGNDPDGDLHTVTCCRTTFEEAYDCAANKLRKAVFKHVDDI